MNSGSQNSPDLVIAKVEQPFSRDLALENDYLRRENKILRTEFGARVALTESDRGILVNYGLRIKDRLAAVICIAKAAALLESPETEEMALGHSISNPASVEYFAHGKNLTNPSGSLSVKGDGKDFSASESASGQVANF